MADPMNEWKELAAQLRVDSIRCTTAAGSGHPTSGMSAADLMAVLLAKYLRYDWADPKHPNNDRLIFSKGHACPVLYAENWLHNSVNDVRYRAERRASAAACDCRILADLGERNRRPASPVLRHLAGDGMYWEDYVCDACQMRWTQHIDCDDQGISSQWEPTK